MAFDFSGFPSVIEVDGITLNFFNLEDAERLDEITSDDTVQRYIPWAAKDKRAYIERTTTARQNRGPRYAIRLGEILIGHFAIFPSPDVQGVIELGYVIDKAYRGQGIIPKVLLECESIIREQMPKARIGLAINDENEASIRVAQKAGFERTDTISDGDRLYIKVGDQIGQ